MLDMRILGYFLFCAAWAFAQLPSPPASRTAVFPLNELRPGLAAVARTVFVGQKIEEFPLTILGVLSNSGPGQNMILARLETARLEQTGVMQGMSGSPVYVDGRLVGAIAFAFAFAKEPIAGIRPIEEMLAAGQASPRVPSQLAAKGSLHLGSLHLGSSALWDAPAPGPADRNSPQAVLTPVSFGGFSAATIRHFEGIWRQLGFAAQQGGAGNRPAAASAPLQAGDMISVQLLRGDLSAGADGTVTLVDGNRIYAFGHRFVGAGAAEFPFAKAEVITPLPNLNTSFKISQALQPLGSILADADAAVVGELGRSARLAQLNLRYKDAQGEKTYKVEMVRHALLSPLLLQMAIFSALDHHFRSVGIGTLNLKATLRFASNLPPLVVEGRYAGDANLAIGASLGAAIPLAFFHQHAQESQMVDSVDVDIEAIAERKQWVIERLAAGQRSAKPGDQVTLRTVLATSEGEEMVRDHVFQVPAHLNGGESLTVTVSDSFTANLLDFRSFYQPGGPLFRSPRELIETINQLHPAGGLYLRVLRSGAAFQSSGREMSNLPASIAATMARAPGQFLPLYQSRLDNREFLVEKGVISGSKTITLEIEK
jgi:hypothetical protein